MDQDLEKVEEEWSEAYHEILDVLYKEAVPGLDYSSLKPGELVDEQPPTYLRHYLCSEKQEDLIEDTLDQYSIPQDLYFEAKKAVLLSSGPSTSRENVEQARKEADLQTLNELLAEDE